MELAVITAKQVAELLLMILAGAVCCKAGVFKPKEKSVLANLLLYLVVPAMVLDSYMVEYDPATFHNLMLAFGLGALVLLCIIFTLLKRGLMSVKYSLLWLLLAVALVIAAAFPYVIYVLRDILSIEMPVNLVFLLMFCFVLVVLLSLSIAITQLAEKCKRLTQANAILEKRVRDLEGKNR